MIDQNSLLAGKVGLVGGIANEHSIAAGCARAFRAAGAEFAITYLKDKAKPFAEPVARCSRAWSAGHQSKCALAGADQDAGRNWIAHFDTPIDEARSRAPERRLVTTDDVGALAMGLVSDLARGVTGNISFVDPGYHVMS